MKHYYKREYNGGGLVSRRISRAEAAAELAKKYSDAAGLCERVGCYKTAGGGYIEVAQITTFYKI